MDSHAPYVLRRSLLRERMRGTFADVVRGYYAAELLEENLWTGALLPPFGASKRELFETRMRAGS